MTSTLSPADADAIFASFLEARRAQHGNLRMELDDSGADGGTDDGGTDDGADGGDDKPQETPEEKLARLEAENASLKTNSRKWEDRAKANKKAADEAARIKAEGMSAEEKAAAAVQEAAEARKELARYKVAAETGIDADLIAGDDEDAMRAFAERLSAVIKKATPKPAPKPDPSQGGKDTGKKSSARDEGLAEAQRRFGKKS